MPVLRPSELPWRARVQHAHRGGQRRAQVVLERRVLVDDDEQLVGHALAVEQRVDARAQQGRALAAGHADDDGGGGHDVTSRRRRRARPERRGAQRARAPTRAARTATRQDLVRAARRRVALDDPAGDGQRVVGAVRERVLDRARRVEARGGDGVAHAAVVVRRTGRRTCASRCRSCASSCSLRIGDLLVQLLLGEHVEVAGARRCARRPRRAVRQRGSRPRRSSRKPGVSTAPVVT